ncbi:MAG: hypothetical protein LBR98_03530 [Syntrophomonadaceae bacterium]|jgi:hypothetical protein|nr:hypothetical protein [Syntrophomonadaceae bacterium]
MDKGIVLIRKNDTTVEFEMDDYHITMIFLPENNYKIIEEIKAILTNSFTDIARSD